MYTDFKTAKLWANKSVTNAFRNFDGRSSSANFFCS